MNYSTYTDYLQHLKHLINRSIINLYFEVKEPISVGDTTEVNMRRIVSYHINGKPLPFIPAESVKGAMRSLTRKISDYPCDKGRHNVDNKKAIQSTMEERLTKIFTSEQLKELNVTSKTNLYQALECPICRLFGSQMLQGKLIFHDMFPSDDANIMTYTFNSINRKTRTVEEHRLFTTEYIMPTFMHTKIIANNIISMQERVLLASLFKVLTVRGLEVGGLKSKGYGSLVLSKDKSNVLSLKLNPSPTKEEVLNNVRALMLREGYYDLLSIDDYITRLL